MPYNDIAINIKASLPSYYSRKSSKYKRGVQTNLILDKMGNLVDKEQKPCVDFIDLGSKDYSSISGYKENLEKAFYEL